MSLCPHRVAGRWGWLPSLPHTAAMPLSLLLRCCDRSPHRISALCALLSCGLMLAAPVPAQSQAQDARQAQAPDPSPAPVLADPARLQQENAALRAELAAARVELAALREALVAARAEAAAPAERERQLAARLETLRANLPAAEGGSLTPVAARARAAGDARQLERLRESARGIDNPDLWRDLRAAENTLHYSQFLLARADNARTVYRTRPGDSLAIVSALFYGDPSQWPRLFDANRHVLLDPQQVPPGVTLVVP